MPPIVLLVFANDRSESSAAYLRDLAGEKRDVRTALRPAIATGRCALVVESDATLTSVGDMLDLHHDDIAVVHFGGHASAGGLHLEDDRGRPRAALTAGLARHLGRLPRLRLVVLNGCDTAAQIDALHRHCRAVAIGTTRPVDDGMARAMARRLYHGLGAGRTVADAFAAAFAEAEAAGAAPSGAARHIRPAGAAGDAGWPWVMRAHPDAPGAVDWRLGEPSAPPARLGADAPDPASDDALAALLADLYAAPDEARAALMRAGIGPAHIAPMTGPPIAWWTTTLARMRLGAGSVPRLLAVARRDFPHNPRLGG